MIDWLTLRIPLDVSGLGPELSKRLRESMNTVHCFDPEGVEMWRKAVVDFDSLRSDTPGICWMTHSDGVQTWLAIGASPASLEHGCNVFGSDDIVHCARVIIEHAAKALRAALPMVRAWTVRRIDITENYLLPTADAVKHALRVLLQTDGGHRRASSPKSGGDSVYWNPKSVRSKGKAYHKGPQLRALMRKTSVAISDAQLEIADRMLRLEHTRGAQFFRDFEKAGRHWFDLSIEDLRKFHTDFFGRMFGEVEVKDMSDVLPRLQALQVSHAKTGHLVPISEGQALAAFRTWSVIKSVGLQQAKESMPRATWYRHVKLLRDAGLGDMDISTAEIVPFRRHVVVIDEPVRSWADCKVAA